ncbi:Fructose-1,6-bisphosphatase class 3 [Porphyridium purpureum]|uniref:Fructose-1,6-bisphosphatase class 3 n=1 Tax=Porphyridium purpureum TaxID=35688 RepID=A0A5J4YP99_PORPP|nr:Fructose-1,6-bisphosphatase class 3 [Porphyridium purpureum]|eukprot:POR6557..scf296_7
MKKVASLAQFSEKQLFLGGSYDGLGLESQGRDGVSCGPEGPGASRDGGLGDRDRYVFDEKEMIALTALARQFPNLDAVAGQMALRTAVLSRPPGNVHIISDIHGDARKLQNVLSNASGTLRPFVEDLFAAADYMDENDVRRLLFFIFNSSDFYAHYSERLHSGITFGCSPDMTGTGSFLLENLLLQACKVLREIVKPYSIDYVRGHLDQNFRKVLMEMMYNPSLNVDAPCVSTEHYICAIAASLRQTNRLFRFLRILSRLIRNLATVELLVGGDLWDRGPRGDRVTEILMNQPNVSIAWGNHDLAWLGAALGCDALIAYVMRVSCRYNCLAQLEEGYGISLAPLEHLSKEMYGDDLAVRFKPKVQRGYRDELTLAQMQKAAAVMQFKLEGQLIKRHPEYQLDQDLVLHTIDLENGTCLLDGSRYQLLDTNFPTLTPGDNAYELNEAERECMTRMKRAFYRSSKLWEQMKWLINRGSAYVVRHDHLLFHGAVPCSEPFATEDGGMDCEFRDFEIYGRKMCGKELFDNLQREIIAALRSPTEYRRDLIWYAWCGPVSPFMAKERVATFMRDLIAEEETHKEKKNPYFALLHEEWFCDKVLREFGCDSDNGLIINGHVPVSVKKDENPVKRSGKAVAIDGAFSEAYGDRGYTLVIEPQKHRTVLAEHHHSEDAFDVMPTVRKVRDFANISSSYQKKLRAEIDLLSRLLFAFELNVIPQNVTARSGGDEAGATV